MEKPLAIDVDAPTSASIEQLELPPPIAAVHPEHLRFAEELAAALNEGQAGNGHVDRDTYRPVAAHHRGTLAAALAIKNAGVPLLYATQYVRAQATAFKPTRAPQIASVAYLERGCIAAWREFDRKQHRRRGEDDEAARDRARRSGVHPTAAGDVVGALMSQLAGERRL